MFKKMQELRQEQFAEVEKAVFKFYGKKKGQIDNNSRKPEHLEIRQVLAFVAYEVIDCITQEEIVFFMKTRDRSTIAKSMKSFRGYLEYDKILAGKITKIKSLIVYEQTKKEKTRRQTQRRRCEIKVRRKNNHILFSAPGIKKKRGFKANIRIAG